MTTVWALIWMGFAFVAGDYAIGWILDEGRTVTRVAVAYRVAVTCFAVPAAAAYAATWLINPIITHYWTI